MDYVKVLIPARNIGLEVIDAKVTAVVQHGSDDVRLAAVHGGRWSKSGLTLFDPLWVELGAYIAYREDAVCDMLREGREYSLPYAFFVFPMSEHGTKARTFTFLYRDDLVVAVDKWHEIRSSGVYPLDRTMYKPLAWRLARQATYRLESAVWLTDDEAQLGLARRSDAVWYWEPDGSDFIKLIDLGLKAQSMLGTSMYRLVPYKE